MIKNDKITSEIRALEISADKGRNFFGYMQKIQKKTTKTGPIRDLDGKLQETDKDMSKAFSDGLSRQLGQPQPPPNINWSTAHPDGPKVPQQQIFITADAVKAQIRKAKRSAAAGPDGLPMLLFSVADDIIAEPLARLYNLINQSGIVPDSFKTAKVKMLHKKKSKDNMGNYRPLSMSNHQGKIWERLINKP
jgi:hypothetical protein